MDFFRTAALLAPNVSNTKWYHNIWKAIRAYGTEGLWSHGSVSKDVVKEKSIELINHYKAIEHAELKKKGKQNNYMCPGSKHSTNPSNACCLFLLIDCIAPGGERLAYFRLAGQIVEQRELHLAGETARAAASAQKVAKRAVLTTRLQGQDKEFDALTKTDGASNVPEDDKSKKRKKIEMEEKSKKRRALSGTFATVHIATISQINPFHLIVFLLFPPCYFLHLPRFKHCCTTTRTSNGNISK